MKRNCKIPYTDIIKILA